MAELKRHIGRLKNSDRRCVVVYMQIPGRTDHALVVDTDALPDHIHQYFMQTVESQAAQNSVNLADVLDRRASTDAGMNIMNSLHRRGLLRPEPISNVIMMPRPNMPYPLQKILEDAGKIPKRPQTQQPAPPVEELGRYNQFNENIKIDNYEANLAMAKNLLENARLLEEEVNRNRAKAYKMAPHLDPNQGNMEKPFTDMSQYLDEEMSPPLAPAPKLKNTPISFETLNSDGLSPQEAAEFQRIMEKAQEHLDKITEEETAKNAPVINLTEEKPTHKKPGPKPKKSLEK